MATRLASRHPFPPIAYHSAAALRGYVLANAGAFPRDPMDRRLLGPVAAGTISPTPTDRNPAGDALLPAFGGASPAPPADADSDGMPDAWERARRLNPSRPDHNGRQLSAAGYTNLEVYLHELSRQRAAAR